MDTNVRFCKKYMDEVIEDYRMQVMVEKADHMHITDDEIMKLYVGVDMCKEMSDVQTILISALSTKGDDALALLAKGDDMTSAIREMVWQKYEEMPNVECGERFVFKKREDKKVTITKTISDETLLNWLLTRVMEERDYSEIGSNDEGVYYIVLYDEFLGDVMCETTKDGEIFIRITTDDQNNQDYVVHADDTFGLYSFCEKSK